MGRWPTASGVIVAEDHLAPVVAVNLVVRRRQPP
jgi:hypothetical protein